MALIAFRRFVSKIAIRLLAFNVLLVFLPVVGVSYLTVYERKLLQAQEQSMVQQARVLAAALSERGPLTPDLTEPILVRLEQRTTARIRVLNHQGRILSDSSLLGPQREADSEDEAGRDPRANWIYRLGSSLFRFIDPLISGPRPALSDDYYSADRPFESREVQEALSGRYGAATRITPGGQRSVTLYSALPVQNEGQIVGVVLASQSTFQILQDLYDVRRAIFGVLLLAVGVAAVLSLLVSATISRPVERLRSQAMVLFDRRGRLKGRLGGSDRLDEIGDLSRALSELSSRLEERMRFIESFAADVSHEFKNPLTSIRAATDMLEEVSDPAERRHFAAMVRTDIARLERLLSDVREITLVDAADEQESEPERIRLGALLEGIVENARRRNPGLRLEVDTLPSTIEIEARGDRLVRVFENLLDNAIDFSPRGGRIRLSMDANGREVSVLVEDEGPGVPLENRERIFDRFFSYRPSEDGSKRHSGLGLAIVKAILEREGGAIALVESSLGGAGFEVRLRPA